MRNATIIGLLAIALTIGMTGVTGSAAAGDVDPDTTFEVDEGEPDECEERVELPNGEEYGVAYKCNLVEVDMCYFVVEGPFGMPQLVPYPCGASINTPIGAQASADPICYKVVYGPMGQPQLAPWPCALQK